jgi:hypothetical protein
MAKNKKRRIPDPPASSSGKKISPAATQQAGEAGSTDEHSPSFRFTHVDENRWQLSDWTSDEINDLINAFKKIEKHTWAQLKSQGSRQPGQTVGCGFKLITGHPELPSNTPEDAKLSEMRVCQRKRIFGFRIGSLYYIIWFDRNHEVCPG